MSWNITADTFAQYKMNDDAATPAVVDAIGSHNGTATTNTENMAIAGLINGALNLNGSTYFTIPYHSDFDFTSAFSIAIWVNLSATAGATRFLMSKYGYGAVSYDGWYINQETNNKISISFRAAGATKLSTTTTAIPLGTWTHLIITWDGTGAADAVKFYFDNTAKSITGSGTNGPAAFNIETCIGAHSTYYNYKLIGALDNIVFVNRVFTTNERAGLFNAGVGTEVLTDVVAETTSSEETLQLTDAVSTELLQASQNNSESLLLSIEETVPSAHRTVTNPESLMLGETVVVENVVNLVDGLALSDSNYVNIPTQYANKSEGLVLGEDFTITVSLIESDSLFLSDLNLVYPLLTIDEELDLTDTVTATECPVLRYDATNHFNFSLGYTSDVANDFRMLGYTLSDLGNDFRMKASWQTPTAGNVGPVSRGKEYVKVYIGGVEQTDAIVDSMNISWVLNGAWTANFDLGRQYDSTRPNDEAIVEIKYDNWRLFYGYVVSVNPGDTPESIKISCADIYWLNNRNTKKYFYVGHKPEDERETFYTTIQSALSTEYSWVLTIGGFVPQTIDAFGAGYSETLTSLIAESGNYAWYYDQWQTKVLYTAGSGSIVSLQRQVIGDNIGLYQVLSHSLTTNVDSIINKLRVQMGSKSWKQLDDGEIQQSDPYINVQAVLRPQPDWDINYEKVVSRTTGSPAHGINYQEPGEEYKYEKVFKDYKLPTVDKRFEEWSDVFEPRVTIYKDNGWKLKNAPPSYYEKSIVEDGGESSHALSAVITDGWTVDYTNRKFTFSTPIYQYRSTNPTVVKDVQVSLRLFKRKYLDANDGFDEETYDPTTDPANDLMFFTSKMGDYPTTILGMLNLSNLNIQEGGVHILEDGTTEIIPSWDDTAFATDIANWNLSKMCDKRIDATLEVTIDTICLYGISLNKRMRVTNMLDEDLNINSISFSFGSFTATISCNKDRYFKRTVSVSNHDTGTSTKVGKSVPSTWGNAGSSGMNAWGSGGGSTSKWG